MHNKKSLFLLIFLILSLLSTVTLVIRTTVFSGKATGTNFSSVTMENSYLFASPIQAKADGKELIRITVFLLDGRGLGIPNQSVNINFTNKQSITDDTGKAIFDISSTTAGKVDITATSDNKTLPQKVKVLFY